MTENDKQKLQESAGILANTAKDTASKAVDSVKSFYNNSDFSNPEYRKDLANKTKRGFKGLLSKAGHFLEKVGSENEDDELAEVEGQAVEVKGAAVIEDKHSAESVEAVSEAEDGQEAESVEAVSEAEVEQAAEEKQSEESKEAVESEQSETVEAEADTSKD